MGYDIGPASTGRQRKLTTEDEINVEIKRINKLLIALASALVPSLEDSVEGALLRGKLFDSDFTTAPTISNHS